MGSKPNLVLISPSSLISKPKKYFSHLSTKEAQILARRREHMKTSINQHHPTMSTISHNQNDQPSYTKATECMSQRIANDVPNPL